MSSNNSQSGRLVTTDRDDNDDLLMDEAHILECLDRAIATRETETVSLKIPKSVMTSLAKVAGHHDMSLISVPDKKWS